jgi:hypothetical protein
MERIVIGNSKLSAALKAAVEEKIGPESLRFALELAKNHLLLSLYNVIRASQHDSAIGSELYPGWLTAFIQSLLVPQYIYEDGALELRFTARTESMELEGKLPENALDGLAETLDHLVPSAYISASDVFKWTRVGNTMSPVVPCGGMLYLNWDDDDLPTEMYAELAQSARLLRSYLMQPDVLVAINKDPGTRTSAAMPAFAHGLDHLASWFEDQYSKEPDWGDSR